MNCVVKLVNERKPLVAIVVAAVVSLLLLLLLLLIDPLLLLLLPVLKGSAIWNIVVCC